MTLKTSLPSESKNKSVPGYHGRLLRIDLSSGRADELALAEAVLRRFIGGSGLGTWILLNEDAPSHDPFEPESSIVFVFSPLVGSPLTTSAKFAVVGKSPLTMCINDSLVSSQFAIAGKRTGFDAIVLTGKADDPSIVVIDDGRVRIEPAAELWGMPCRAAEESLQERLGQEYAIAVIGPAGERRVRYATVSHDGRHAGRGGNGAVLGSKNVKAIAVRGSQRTNWADPSGLVTMSKELSRRSFGPATAKYRELGTASNLLVFNRLGALPTRNFQQGSFEGAQQISAEQLTETRAKARKSCAACTIGCEHLYSIGGKDATNGVRLEYENLFALGPLCGVNDPDVVLAASRLCDDLGIDTISAGGTIAFAMECVERGLLEEPWLRFGDGQALLRALEQIGERRGLGQLLGEGSRRAAATIGQNSIAFAAQVKGLEMPGYEPRALQTMALGFAVGTRGADHNRSGAYELDFSDSVDRRNPSLEAASLAVETEDRAALIDSLILCKFLRGIFDDYYVEFAAMLNLVTGWDVTADELRQTSRRIVSAKKLFNIRAGWTPGEDTLPDRFFDDALPEGAKATMTRERFSELIAAYNRARGWTSEGWIDERQLLDLGLME